MRVLAYVYPGWHSIPERDAAFYPGFTEWDLVYQSAPRFDGHVQPRLPLWGRYDDRDPIAVGRRVALCREHAIDGLVYGFFWCRGKRVFQDALDLGYLGSDEGRRFPFALMWANRMPRRVLPVRGGEQPVIEADRLVPTDVEDFVDVRPLPGRALLRARQLPARRRARVPLDLRLDVLHQGARARRRARGDPARARGRCTRRGCRRSTWRRSSPTPR